jgi:hypothetical protein
MGAHRDVVIVGAGPTGFLLLAIWRPPASPSLCWNVGHRTRAT